MLKIRVKDGKRIFIDTNSVIDYLDNKLPEKANELIDGIESKISVITRMELLAWSGASNEQTFVLEEFINTSDVFALDEPVILKAIDIRKKHKTKLPDAIIAATAITNDYSLISNNDKDFKGIKGLKHINPYSI